MPEIVSFAGDARDHRRRSVDHAGLERVRGDVALDDQGVGTVTGTSVVVTPTTTTVYALTATNDAGTFTAATSAIVTPAPPRPVIASFTASPSHVAPGGSAILDWSVPGATSLSIDNGVGPSPGEPRRDPPATTTYTLTATNANGSVTATATVTVTAAPLPVFTSFTASPSSVAAGGRPPWRG